MNGIIYVASDEKYAEMAARSARSLRQYESLPIYLFTTNPQPDLISDVTDAFDKIIEVETQEPHVAKVMAIMESPFNQTIFMDADTRVCAPINEVFAVLDRVHIAGVQQPAYRAQDDIPSAFPEINTGFLVYKRCKKVDSLLAKWLEFVSESKQEPIRDQWAFRKALYESKDVMFCTLPTAYNFWLDGLNIIGGGVKILHGSNVDLEKAEKAIRHRGSWRIWLPSKCAVVDSRHFWEVDSKDITLERKAWKT